jgi:hypothetical protein
MPVTVEPFDSLSRLLCQWLLCIRNMSNVDVDRTTMLYISTRPPIYPILSVTMLSWNFIITINKKWLTWFHLVIFCLNWWRSVSFLKQLSSLTFWTWKKDKNIRGQYWGKGILSASALNWHAVAVGFVKNKVYKWDCFSKRLQYLTGQKCLLKHNIDYIFYPKSKAF